MAEVDWPKPLSHEVMWQKVTGYMMWRKVTGFVDNADTTFA